MTTQDILNMTISDLIEQTNLKVKLGAKQGSAFIFCGNIGNIDCDSLDEDICNQYRRNIKSATGSIQALKKKPKGYQDYEREMIAKQEKDKIEYEISKDGYRRWFNELSRRMQTLRETKSKNERRLKGFTTIRGRQIVEIYKSVDEEDTYIILYDGIENGNAWTTAEFESGVINFGNEA